MNKWIDIILAKILPDWRDLIINDYEFFAEFNNVLNIIYENDPYWTKTSPKLNKIFRPFKYSSINDIKLIMLNNNPYDDECVADGLAFSANKNAQIPLKLYNIFKHLMDDNLIKYFPENGSLKNWAKQGILLLNINLTIEIGELIIHNFWLEFTKKLLNKLFKIKKNDDLIIVACDEIPEVILNEINVNHQLILYKNTTISKQEGLIKEVVDKKNNNSFTMINNYLSYNNKKPIIWTNHITLFTDGSASNNGYKNAVGRYAFYIPQFSVKKAHKINDRITPTNQRAELYAILEGLIYINNIGGFKGKCTIISDSLYAIDILTKYYDIWVRQNKLHKHANIDLIKLIKEEINKFGGNLEFNHINSHQKRPDNKEEFFYWCGNYISDLLCKK